MVQIVFFVFIAVFIFIALICTPLFVIKSRLLF